MRLSTKNTLSLDFSTKNGLYFTSNTTWKGVLPYKVQKVIEAINPFAFFCFNNEPLIFFFHNPINESSIHQQCWNFNKAPIVIIFRGEQVPINDNGNELFIQFDEETDIYNGFDISEDNGLLKPLSKAKITDFSYWNIVSGRVWEQYATAFKNENKVDNRLLKNIGVGRTQLIKNIQKEENPKEAQLIANRILGRLIFIRYLIDRKVQIHFNQKKYLLKDDLTEIIQNPTKLYNLFYHILEKVFYGDLFPFVESLEYEKSQLKQTDLSLISSLFKGDNIISGQRSLFHLYDFSIIPVELVSNIYEYFMGKEKQNQNKAFYTPPFLVDYLVNETIEPYLQNQDSAHCTTLDPACGSGIFLVETLRRIIVKFKTLNTQITNDINLFKYEIINLLKDNIYGIDKDRDAIDVAIFSLYTTLLDFIEDPKDIEGFRFPYLLRTNFFEADFFETDFSHNKSNNFVEKFKRVKLDFIIGNPPWGRVKDSPYMDYAKKRLKREPDEKERLQQLFPKNANGKKRTIRLVENNEIAQAFLLRTSDFSTKNQTTCALLVTSKVLHNGQSNVFRNYLLTNTQIEKVVDFSAVRKHIFAKPKGAKNTVGPCAFLIYNWTKNNQKNIVQHYSPKLNRLFKVFKILAIQKFDYKKVPQQDFLEYDWAWKVFLYGNVLDFKFIKFLKEHFASINQFTSSTKDFIKKQGIILGGGDSNDTSFLTGFPLIDARNDIQSYHIEVSKQTEWFIKGKIWDRQFAHRSKKDLFEQGLFNGNSILIRKGLNPSFRCISAFSAEKGAFRDSVTGIKAKNGKDISLLKNIVGFLNSTYFSYYIFNTSSSTGIEREQVHNSEKLALPIIKNDKIPILVDNISTKKKQLSKYQNNKSNTKRSTLNLFNDTNGEVLKTQIEVLEQQIEQEIHNSFNFTNEEKALINFSQEISIPLFKGEERPFQKVRQAELEQYSKVFEKYFTQIFNKSGKYFKIEVYESEFMIGIQFKIESRKPKQVFNYIQDKEQQNIIDMLSVISYEQITDKVFIQKDVKIINKKSFWVIKPNEYKCWHEAVAYLDLDEFIPRLLATPSKTAKTKILA